MRGADDHHAEVVATSRTSVRSSASFVPPLERVAGLVPGDESAIERRQTFAVEPRLDQPPRRTGAGVFVGSGAVQDDLLVLGHRLQSRMEG
jgi:hypothetical protein